MYHKAFVLSLVVLLIVCFTLLSHTAADAPAASQPSSFGIMVSTDQHTYIRPAIQMSLTVFNNSPAPVTINFKSSQRYDFTIYNSKGQKVWQWSDGQMFQPIMGKIVLQPSQTVTYTAEYQSKTMLNEDLYTLKGELTAIDPRTRKPRVMEGTVSFWAVLTK